MRILIRLCVNRYASRSFWSDKFRYEIYEGVCIVCKCGDVTLIRNVPRVTLRLLIQRLRQNEENLVEFLLYALRDARVKFR